MDAFDADALIDAATPGSPLGSRVAALFPSRAHEADDPPVGVGSVLLLPEVLTKPLQLRATNEAAMLRSFLTWLALHPVDLRIAELAVSAGARYGLRAPHAVHLASAVHAGADRFITNDRKDFPRSIEEIKITYPDDLPDPDSPDPTGEAHGPG